MTLKSLALLTAGSLCALASPEAQSEKLVASLETQALESLGINPQFLVAIRVSKKARRIALAEHRPGSDSLLHILDRNGKYLHNLSVPSPQLADFTLAPNGATAYLVGSYGTRFYTADLSQKTSRLTYSSLPEREGFRALPPVSIWHTSVGPVVYGLFYQNESISKDLGFARIAKSPALEMSTASLEKELKQVIAYVPHPSLRSVLVLHQDTAQSPNPDEYKGRRHLTYVDPQGKTTLLDTASDLFGATWSPDGKIVAYLRKSENSTYLMLWRSGGKPIEISKGNFMAPVFLAGGKNLVISTLENQKDQKVWVLDHQSGEIKPLDVPVGPCIYSADAEGSALAAWGPWGLRAFVF